MLRSKPIARPYWKNSFDYVEVNASSLAIFGMSLVRCLQLIAAFIFIHPPARSTPLYVAIYIGASDSEVSLTSENKNVISNFFPCKLERFVARPIYYRLATSEGERNSNKIGRGKFNSIATHTTRSIFMTASLSR